MAGKGAIYIGLMSGTSADGIDAALVRFGDEDGSDFEVIAFKTTEFSPELKKEILEVSDARSGTVDRVCRLDAVLGEWFARAAIAIVESAGVSREDVHAIGSHGQTIHHLPDETTDFGVLSRSTLQIGNASVIAERTGIQTVSDFRSRDLAAGGQGAPLVPLVDFLLFRSESLTRVLVNIGGIANVTLLPAGCETEDVVAFDTGPGNVIIDGLVVRMTDGGKGFDAGGNIAESGEVRNELLWKWMDHPYFKRAPPKSTGREMFGGDFIDRLVKEAGRVETTDLIATATAFTAESIIQGLRSFASDYDGIKEVFVSGGGCANHTLMREIRDRAPGIHVGVTDDLGLSAEAKEAVAFALFAHRTVKGLPGNLPGVTGASRAVVLGQITPGLGPRNGG